jgi:hypothetical protein
VVHFQRLLPSQVEIAHSLHSHDFQYRRAASHLSYYLHYKLLHSHVQQSLNQIQIQGNSGWLLVYCLLYLFSAMFENLVCALNSHQQKEKFSISSFLEIRQTCLEHYANGSFERIFCIYLTLHIRFRC